MLGCLRTTDWRGGRGGEVEGVGWLSVPWGVGGRKSEGGKKQNKNGKKPKGSGSSTWPTHPVQSCPSDESSELAWWRRGVQRRRELQEGGCRGSPGRRKGNSVGARFQSGSSRRLLRRRRHPRLLGLAFSSHLWRRLLLGVGGKEELDVT